jgi:hypothetical protein
MENPSKTGDNLSIPLPPQSSRERLLLGNLTLK